MFIVLGVAGATLVALWLGKAPSPPHTTPQIVEGEWGWGNSSHPTPSPTMAYERHNPKFDPANSNLGVNKELVQIDPTNPHAAYYLPGNEVAKLEAEAQLKVQREAVYQKILQKAIDRLAKGEFFHTIPKTITADVPVLIEAGIAQKVTKQVLRDLQIQGTPEIKTNVPYDGLGTEVKLDVDKDFFKVRNIKKTGVKPIVPGFPESWMWELTPTRQGKSTITILVVIQIDAPGIVKGYKQEKVVFKEERNVQVNVGYSVSKFTGAYWKEISTLVFGSGSLAWAFSWFINRKKDKPDDSDDEDNSPFGLAGFLNQKPNGKTK